MKIESKVLIYSMINNLIISIAKIAGGLILGLSSLLADGLHTFCDFATDIICMIGTKISKHRPTKKYPFGFGRIEYLTNLFIGIILFLLGIFIIYNGFIHKPVIPPLSLMYLLVGAIILKSITIIVMHVVGKKTNSQVLITSVEESSMDLVSSIIVAIIAIILQFSDTFPILRHVDLIGSIIISLIIFETSIEIIKENSLSLIGEVEQNEELINKLSNFISEFKGVEDKKITLIKYGSYYQLYLVLDLDNKLTLRQVSNLEKKIKKSITRHSSFDIKYVTIYVTNKID